MNPIKKKLKLDTGQPAIDDLKRLSVKISKKTCEAAPELLGTGTIVCDGEDFYVITAAHCFRDDNGQQNCRKEDIVLTLYDSQNKPTNIDVKGMELSDTDKDTAIISIKTPPDGFDYFNTLKLLGNEMDGEGFVFGYTEKRPEGRLFTYKRVNTNVWSNKDNITEKGEDFFKSVKGSSGGGMLVRIDERVYCTGFIHSTFDKESTLDDVKVQPVNLFKTNWKDAFFQSIEDALNEPQIDGIGNKLQQECFDAWRKAYDIIYKSKNKELTSLLPRINEIRKQYTIPKNVSPQNDVVSLLFRRKGPWTEESQELFLMALEDQGLWLSIYGDNIPAIYEGIKERPLAKKLERRAITLTKSPNYDETKVETNDDQSYYEQMLRYAYALDFTSVKKMASEWNAKGFWKARKALFANLFENNRMALEELNDYLNDKEDNIPNEKFIATAVYNVINSDFSDRKSYAQFTQNGHEGISTILANIADNIDKRHNKVSVYGIHQRFLIGGEDTASVPEALRLLHGIIDAGILTSFIFTNFVSRENWMKVVKHLFTSMPYPILFYTLMYTDEKLLKRVGQEYAYTEDIDVIKVLPDIQLRILNAIGDANTHRINNRINIGLYLISSELYIALNEDIWFEQYRDNVLRHFCQEDIVKNVSHNDPIFINVSKGMRFVKNTARRIEIFKMLTSVLTYNSRLINGLICNYLWMDDTLMSNNVFIKSLMNIIKERPLKDTYMLVSKFGKQRSADEELRILIDEVVKRDGLDFGSDTSTAICMLSGVVKDNSIKVDMKGLLLKRDIWNCGITKEHYTDPHPIGLEMVDTSIGWTPADWSTIKNNMFNNLDLISSVRSKEKGTYKYFYRQYIALLSNMRYFIRHIMKIEGCEVHDVEVRINDLLQELRGFKNVTTELSSDDYDTVVDGVRYLRDRFVDEGLMCCKMEIQLLINRVQMQVPTALEYCVWLLSDMVEHYPEEMTQCFGNSLLEVVKKYADEFEYETLFVNKTSIYKWMRKIAKGLSSMFGEEKAINYWLKDKKVNRFNFMEL